MYYTCIKLSSLILQLNILYFLLGGSHRATKLKYKKGLYILQLTKLIALQECKSNSQKTSQRSNDQRNLKS